MSRKIVVFELNEVPNRVIDTYIEENPKSNWASVVKKSARFTAATPDTLKLHPKSSWQTFHRGVADHEHGYVEYNQTEGKGDFPPLWDLVRKAGKSVGVGASIGSYPVPENTDNVEFYLPDPFAPTFQAVPEYLSSFQQLNTSAVQRSGRNVRKGGFGVADVSGFLMNLPRLGITPTTVFKTVKQLVSERMNSARIVRRRNVQALMSFDVAFKQVKSTKPEFSTIFANHVASSMHRYWAAKFPNDYIENKMPQEWRDTYSGEVDAAMHDADYMLGKLNKLAKSDPNVTVLVIASMGQEAIEHEPTFNQLMVGDFDAFMNLLGFAKDEYEKGNGMEPEYVVSFTRTDGLEKFKQACGKVVINGKNPLVKPMNDMQSGFLVFQNNINIDSIEVDGRTVSLEEAGLVLDKIQDMSGSTAQHVPGGCCFAFNGESDLSAHSNLNEEINLVAVTSSILSALDIDPAPYMQDPVPEIVDVLTRKKAHVAKMVSGARGLALN